MSTIRTSNNHISVELSVFVYKDIEYPNGDMYIAYCPELDLAGYDTTEENARASFGCVLREYLDYATENGTLEADLINHGWRKMKNGTIKEPTLNVMLRNTQLRNVLKQKSYNKYPVPIYA